MPKNSLPPNSRRNFLRAAGVSLALPWLESLAPAAAAVMPRRRMVLICTPLGLHFKKSRTARRSSAQAKELPSICRTEIPRLRDTRGSAID